MIIFKKKEHNKGSKGLLFHEARIYNDIGRARKFINEL